MWLTSLRCVMNKPDDLSSHRVRSNVWPQPAGHDGHGAPLYPWQTDTPTPLIAAVEAVYDALEDRS